MKHTLTLLTALSLIKGAALAAPTAEGVQAVDCDLGEHCMRCHGKKKQKGEW